jgi:SAM-dependent methyltransferase
VKAAYRSELAAEVYDIGIPVVGHSFGDVEFYRDRLADCRGRILEPAVGNGRILIPLLEAGLVVDGLDSSPEMLARCRKHCSERGLDPTLREGGMESFSLPERYEAVIVPAGSFLLLEDRRDSLEALRRFREHLVPGGRLILDLELRTDFCLDHVSTRTFTTSEGDLITLESKLFEVNFLDQYAVVFLKYEKWRDGKLTEAELHRFPLRWYGIEEFKLILESEGFSEITVSAEYEHRKAPSSADQTFTFEAHRV